MPTTDALIGKTVSHYRILERVGGGGMGVVYRAVDTRLSREVALKFLPDETSRDSRVVERFQREARAASVLNHPNICTIHDVGEIENRHFIVMEYLDGRTLNRVLDGGPLATAELLELGVQMADAVEAAHARGIIHRDIKPGNVIVTERGQAKILDFGIAQVGPAPTAGADAMSQVETRTGASRLTRSGAPVGTIAYMSPEQARGEVVDARTDVFSLGVVLYEMATGRPPFVGDTAAVVFDAILNREPVPADRVDARVPSELGRIIGTALAKDRSARFPTMAALRGALSNLRHLLALSAPASPGKATTSVAVLYLENLGGAEQEEYFRDGITEDIITELAKIERLQVFPRAAVVAFRDKAVTGPEVGRQLSATHVLCGSIRRAGQRLRVTAQMVESTTGRSVWAERYDREMKDVFDVQEDIARCIANALRISLSPQEERTISRKPTTNLHAYDYFLRGRNYTRRQERELALEMFEKALGCDPDFALAHAGIANVCGMMYYLSRSPLDRASRRLSQSSLRAGFQAAGSFRRPCPDRVCPGGLRTGGRLCAYGDCTPIGLRKLLGPVGPGAVRLEALAGGGRAGRTGHPCYRRRLQRLCTLLQRPGSPGADGSGRLTSWPPCGGPGKTAGAGARRHACRNVAGGRLCRVGQIRRRRPATAARLVNEYHRLPHDLQRGLHVQRSGAEGGSSDRAQEGYRGRLR